MDKYKSYLATQVLNEGQVVTYRGLSRALKVHVTLAKQMLFSFHASQTAKHPKSLTATYIICGTIPPLSTKTQREISSISNGDTDIAMMESSPPPSSWLDDSGTPATTQINDPGEDYDPADAQVPLTHIVIVREEELEEVKAEFDDIQWIHIYSLQPSSPSDIHVISAANDMITKSYLKSVKKDPTEPLQGLGTIINKHAVWRDLANTTAGASKITKPVATGTTISTKAIPTLSRQSSSNISSKSAPAAKNKPSIMSSFAKTPKAAPKAANTTTRDTKMKESTNFSDDDEDDEDDEIDEAALRAAEDTAAKTAAAREAKTARQEKLKAMMDSDDEDVKMEEDPSNDNQNENAPDKKDADADAMSEDEKAPEAVDDSAALDAKLSADKPEVEENITTENGRKRGRRRVLKKRRFQDEDGCLVTKEEMEWESFSEDEAVPNQPDLKKQRQPLPPPSAAKKKGASGGTNKQVNIMAFFGKK